MALLGQHHAMRGAAKRSASVGRPRYECNVSNALPLALAVSPAGELQLDPRPPEGSAAPAELAHAFMRDFAEGPGKALLELAARHPAAPLPPSLAFFRELAALFLGRLRGMPEQGPRAAVAAPGDELPRLAAAAPPMAGGEYLDAAALEWLWSALGAALRKELVATGASVAEWFAARGSAWSVVGRVCFHLAENKRDPERPFAFLATYTTRLSGEARPQHRPLGEALRDAKEKHALLTLLVPVQKAAARSPLVRELVESAELYSPQAWTAREAHRFLRETPALEEAGIVVRVPDWWKRRARVGVQVTVGGRAPQGLGLDALVDFDARLALEGEPLSAAEVRALHRAEDGLVLVRNRWVELDKQKLDEVLARFELAQRQANGGAVPLLEAMRLLAGAESESDAPVDLASRGELTRGRRCSRCGSSAKSAKAKQAKQRPRVPKVSGDHVARIQQRGKRIVTLLNEIEESPVDLRAR
jgi:non-specific serine/threonine protein kinase